MFIFQLLIFRSCLSFRDVSCLENLFRNATIFRRKKTPPCPSHTAKRPAFPGFQSGQQMYLGDALATRKWEVDGWQVSARYRKKHRKTIDRPKDRYNDTSKNGPTDTNDHFQQLYLGQLMNTEMDICNVYVQYIRATKKTFLRSIILVV